MAAFRASSLALLGLFLAIGGGGCDQLREMIERKQPIDKERSADDEDEEEEEDEEEDEDEDEEPSKKTKKNKKKGEAGAVADESDDDDSVKPFATKLSDLSGSYRITTSSNPGGSAPYRGTVSLSRDGDTYSIAWTITSSPPYKGIAVPVGSILGVGWGMGAEYGVAVYRIKKGVLEGRWVTATSGSTLGQETLAGSPDLEGSYQMTGQTPAGDSYRGIAKIKRAGDAFHVEYAAVDGRDAIEGVGIRDGDVLTVGWGTKGRQAGVVSYRADGDQLVGRWAAPGGSQLGTENLAKTR